LGLWNWITSLEPNEYQSIYKRLKMEERNNQKKNKNKIKPKHKLKMERI
jgi:hypothetical protein